MSSGKRIPAERARNQPTSAAEPRRRLAAPGAPADRAGRTCRRQALGVLEAEADGPGKGALEDEERGHRVAGDRPGCAS